ncbi:hypothetical protein ACLSSQ_00415 [Azospira sp. APE16]|uniref:hypothetical protein n=1 Tax=Azospira sp. APE16 TaxID=3394231 RepID=UPI001B56930A|nr:hypothetical protein [Chromatiaceae bacterium]
MNREIVEVITRELAVIHSGKPEVVAIQNHHLEVVEVARQGPPGPSSTDTFNDDLVLAYQIAKL